MLTLPEIQPERLAIKLKPAAERMIKKGHPWVFSDSIKKQSAEGKAGDLAIIYDNKKNKFLAVGLLDPHSPIRIKLLQVHQSANIDAAWFKTKIQTAFDLRKPLLETDTNSYRLLFGENDGMPGFITDVYANVLVVKLYSAAWFPYLKEILPQLINITKSDVLVLRLSRSLQQMATDHKLHDGQVLHGDLKAPEVIFKEHGLSFTANVIKGHKTGYFLDHRANRKRVGSLAEDKTVLDVFAYAGGFSVHALAGGAREVTSLDISKQALEMAKKNAVLNVHSGKHLTIAADAFDGLQNLIRENKQFDIVVIDPPSFAKKESEVDGAKNSYRRLAKLGAQLVSKGGTLLLASCSSRIKADDFFELCENALMEASGKFKLIDKTFHDIDHPISFAEGAYLKAGYYRNGN